MGDNHLAPYMFYAWHVIGFERELALLERDIRQKEIHHAYLFIGPENIGKFRVAKSFAGILQCPKNFCRTCPTCIQMEKKCHPDTIEFEDDTQSLKIETIRALIARLSLTKQSAYKVTLIENIERLTLEAANTLLKILEEPPPQTVFIMTAQSLQHVLPTIRSRVRIVTFHAQPLMLVTAEIKKMYPTLDAETLSDAIFLSQGKSGMAIQLIQNPEALQALRELYRTIRFLVEDATIATRMNAIPDVVREQKQLNRFLSLMIFYHRQKLLSERDPEKQNKNIQIIEKIDRIVDLSNRNVNEKLLLEDLMLSL